MAFLRMWVGAFRGSGNATLGDFFDQLWIEYSEAAPPTDEETEASSRVLPVTFLAQLLQRYGSVPFDVRTYTSEELHA